MSYTYLDGRRDGEAAAFRKINAMRECLRVKRVIGVTDDGQHIALDVINCEWTGGGADVLVRLPTADGGE